MICDFIAEITGRKRRPYIHPLQIPVYRPVRITHPVGADDYIGPWTRLVRADVVIGPYYAVNAKALHLWRHPD